MTGNSSSVDTPGASGDTSTLDAKTSGDGQAGVDTTELFIIRVDDSLYAFNATAVDFVAPATVPVRVPTAPGVFLGVVHLRGQIIAVGDLLLAATGVPAIHAVDTIADKKLLIFRSAKARFAIIADSVLGMHSVRDDTIRPTDAVPAEGSARAGAVSATAHVDHGGEVAALIAEDDLGAWLGSAAQSP